MSQQEQDPTVGEAKTRASLHDIAECWAWKEGDGTAEFRMPPLLLVPMGVHPCDLGNEMEDVDAWAQDSLVLDYGNAWDQLWNDGRGRRPGNGGTAEGFKRATAVGVHFVPCRIGDKEIWLPRALDHQLWRNSVNSDDDEPVKDETMQEEKGGSFEVLVDGKVVDGGDAAAGQRGLTPETPGQVEERGWLTWCEDAGRAIAVGDA